MTSTLELTRYPKPEIMSPAGYLPQMHAAIEAGADAIYFGLRHFTARAKVGFDIAELPDVMKMLHQRGVRGYLTFNTLVYDSELAEAARSLEQIAKAGTDAIIVQDLGVARLAKHIAPHLEIHGSTQMSITSAEGVNFAQQFGVSRVVLARELSLAEIAQIRKHTTCQLEMFVHGALCVSYSGQCFSSEAWGGRSANRGQCAQACRLPYDIVVDDEIKPLDDELIHHARYVLSPGDLMALDHLPEIIKLGISSLKIEGRYKDENYVALTTAAYRKAVDAAYAGSHAKPDPREVLLLEQVYSRGLGDYFISGTNHQTVVNGRSPRHRGVFLGKVHEVFADHITFAPSDHHLLSPLKPGDGVVFDSADWRSPEEPEEGGRVYRVQPSKSNHSQGKNAPQNKTLDVFFGSNAIRFSRIRPGDYLWRSHDPDIAKSARPFTQAKTPLHKQPLSVHVIAHEGQIFQSAWRLNDDIVINVNSDKPLQKAHSQPSTASLIKEQFNRLGNTPYELTEMTADIQGKPFAPSSLLNDLRRQAVELLIETQCKPSNNHIEPADDALRTFAHSLKKQIAQNARSALSQASAFQIKLNLLVRTPDQLHAAISLAPQSITLDYLDLYGLRDAVNQVQKAGIVARVASPRVLKPNEERIVNFLLSLNCDLVVRSTGLLKNLTGRSNHMLIGDFSLNTANAITAHTYLNFGISRITPTHDLNAEQITQLSREIGCDNLEVIAYHHLPVFHTEHCVFCRFLSHGTSFKDCGHPCEKHRLALRDSSGRSHPVMADVGCRNTVYGAQAQDASPYLERWLNEGVKHFRFEFVHETAEQIKNITSAYQKAFAGKLPFNELTHTLRQLIPQGITEGSFFVGRS